MIPQRLHLKHSASVCMLSLALALGPALLSEETPPSPDRGNVAVRHQRSLWWDKAGALQLEQDGLRFTPSGKHGEGVAVALPWNAIQQLTLGAETMEIVTYQDQRWQLGRDRHFRFTAESPTADSPAFATWTNSLRTALGDRLVLTIPTLSSKTIRWSIPAKRNGFPTGAEGALVYDGEQLRFESEKPGESRVWPLAHIDTATRISARELLVVAPERAVADQGGMRSFSFQLKQPLATSDFRDLWRSIESAHGGKLRFQPEQ